MASDTSLVANRLAGLAKAGFTLAQLRTAKPADDLKKAKAVPKIDTSLLSQTIAAHAAAVQSGQTPVTAKRPSLNGDENKKPNNEAAEQHRQLMAATLATIRGLSARDSSSKNSINAESVERESVKREKSAHSSNGVQQITQRRSRVFDQGHQSEVIRGSNVQDQKNVPDLKSIHDSGDQKSINDSKSGRDSSVHDSKSVCGSSIHDISARESSVHNVSVRDSTVHDVSARDSTIHDISARDSSVHDLSARESSVPDTSGRELTLHDISAQESSVHDINARESSVHALKSVHDSNDMSVYQRRMDSKDERSSKGGSLSLNDARKSFTSCSKNLSLSSSQIQQQPLLRTLSMRSGASGRYTRESDRMSVGPSLASTEILNIVSIAKGGRTPSSQSTGEQSSRQLSSIRDQLENLKRAKSGKSSSLSDITYQSTAPGTTARELFEGEMIVTLRTADKGTGAVEPTTSMLRGYYDDIDSSSSISASLSLRQFSSRPSLRQSSTTLSSKQQSSKQSSKRDQAEVLYYSSRSGTSGSSAVDDQISTVRPMERLRTSQLTDVLLSTTEDGLSESLSSVRSKGVSFALNDAQPYYHQPSHPYQSQISHRTYESVMPQVKTMQPMQQTQLLQQLQQQSLQQPLQQQHPLQQQQPLQQQPLQQQPLRPPLQSISKGASFTGTITVPSYTRQSPKGQEGSTPRPTSQRIPPYQRKFYSGMETISEETVSHTPRTRNISKLIVYHDATPETRPAAPKLRMRGMNKKNGRELNSPRAALPAPIALPTPISSAPAQNAPGSVASSFFCPCC